MKGYVVRKATSTTPSSTKASTRSPAENAAAGTRRPGLWRRWATRGEARW